MQSERNCYRKQICHSKSVSTYAEHVQVKTMNPQEEVHAIKKASKPKTNRKPKDHKRGGKPPKPPIAQDCACPYCGQQHPRDKRLCLARGKTCGGCGRKNHFRGVCRQHDKRVNLLCSYEQSDSEDEILTVEQVFTTSTSEHPRKLFAQMKINSETCKIPD